MPRIYELGYTRKTQYALYQRREERESRALSLTAFQKSASILSLMSLSALEEKACQWAYGEDDGYNYAGPSCHALR